MKASRGRELITCLSRIITLADNEKHTARRLGIMPINDKGHQEYVVNV